MIENPVLFEEKDQIGLLTLNRPASINALNQSMIENLHRVLDELQEKSAVRVLILTGAGQKGFCSGMDIKESAPKLFEATCEQIYYYQSIVSALIAKMRKIPQPIIAAIDGVAAGAGFSFALAADIRIITPQAYFNAAYINLGLGGADLASSYFLPRLIGTGRAYEFLLTGNAMTAPEAMALGLASRMVEKEKLMDVAYDMARKMVEKNPLGLRMTKEAINLNIDAASLEQAMHIENRNQSFLIAAMKFESQSK